MAKRRRAAKKKPKPLPADESLDLFVPRLHAAPVGEVGSTPIVLDVDEQLFQLTECSWCGERHSAGPERCAGSGVGSGVATYRPTTPTMQALAAIPDDIAVWRPDPSAFSCSYGCKGIAVAEYSKPTHVWDCPWWWHEGKEKSPF